MTELANTKPKDVALLDNLAMQARTFVQGACMNLLQLGRVLTEAKPLVGHGEWESWIKANAKMSKRTAEQYMQAYAEFGLNSQIAELGTTKVLKLLPMPTEDRDKLLAENDVSTMSTRQLEEAIRQQKDKLTQEARAEVQAEIDRANAACAEAERQVRLLKEEGAPIPKEIQDELAEKQRQAETYKAEAERLAETAREAMNQRRAAEQELSTARRDLKETEEMLTENQQEYNRIQAELLNAQSAIAKGDAERTISQQLTADDFAAAVRQFVGSVAQMPFMGTTFSMMDRKEVAQYDEFLQTVEDWAKRSRSAINTVEAEVVYHVE